jgi:NAD(P)-dependent dehydrogenase (short-subunit alcohol dehydrogenase family)
MTATNDPSKAVLVTGCPTGIGRATAEHLAQRGWNVYASARHLDSIQPLAASGCKLLELDVCDEQSMRSAVQQVEQAEGAVGVLINNAGYSQSGAVEDVPMELVRRQFETNVFGLLRMCQLVLPAMRRQRFGRIVNVSSIGGRLAFPGGGIYHGTKHAVEGISDALRFEVRGFGVDVVVVEPGLIKTQFADTAVASIEGAGDGEGAYAGFNAAVAKTTAEAYDGPFGKLGGGPETVARKIEKAISAGRPKARYPVTASARLILAQRRLMTDRVWDSFLRTQFPQPGRAKD